MKAQPQTAPRPLVLAARTHRRPEEEADEADEAAEAAEAEDTAVEAVEEAARPTEAQQRFLSKETPTA